MKHWHLMWTFTEDGRWVSQHSRPARDGLDDLFSRVESVLHEINVSNNQPTLDRTVGAATLRGAWEVLDAEYPGILASWDSHRSGGFRLRLRSLARPPRTPDPYPC